MAYHSRSQEDVGLKGSVPLDYVDLREFISRCNDLNKDIKSSSSEASPFEKDLDEAESFPAINPSFIRKWQNFLEIHPNLEEKDLYQMILSDDAGLSTDMARSEAALAMRIARSRLAAVEAYKADESIFNGPKPARSIPVSTGPTYSNESSEGDDVILTITIFNSTKLTQTNSTHRQELEIKASESLATFTNQIYCLSNRVAKDLASESESQIIFSSSFLFIENVFYDDELDGSVSSGRPSDIYYNAMRAVGEYSVTANLISSDPANVQRRSLKSTKWLDLKIRLNTPYLFAHLGGCEHTILISQVRSINPIHDPKPVPSVRVSQALKVRRRKCRICENYAGTKMLINDKLMPENPCIICDRCFEGFHGTEKSSWYADFEVVPYHHES